uniref:Putative transcriptional regulator n=1 Tax=uncultured Acidobacteriota bacterium TaxID=171953 RepID=Q7X2Y4_9BACT|nr:putative transcriptional regulator [uncultured Acidobacteriota bacterium]
MSSHKSTRPVGDQELALLHVVGDCGQVSVGEAAERFGQPRGLARSTVLTMMERLRRKGHLTRRQVDGVYRYSPRTTPGAAVRQAVQRFVDRTLRGSITPFVSYLAEREQLSDEELAELETTVQRLQSRRRKNR